MTQPPREVVFWKGAGNVRSDIIRALQADGCAIKVVGRLEEILDYLERRKISALIVDATDSEHETSSRIVELSSTERLFKTPLVFFGAGREDSFSFLEKSYLHFVGLLDAADVSKLLTSLDALVTASGQPSLRKGSGRQEKIASGTIDRLQLMQHLDPTRLASSYGGTVFASASRPSSFDDNILVPPHPNRAQLIELLGDITSTSRPLGAHARRVAYISSALASGLGFPKDQDVAIRASALLLNGSFLGQLDLAAVDFLYEEMETKAAEIADGIEEAAGKAMNRLDDGSISKTMRLVAEILRRREMFDSVQQILNSQCVLIAEMAGRSCWKGGIWSANGAHRLIRELRHETHYSLDKKIVNAMCRIISEASCARHAVEGKSASRIALANQEMNKVLVEEARSEAAEFFGSVATVIVELPDIRPGMRLAQPLLTSEGRLVLRAGIQLDEQLIWSLWQLGALVPMEKLVTVLKK